MSIFKQAPFPAFPLKRLAALISDTFLLFAVGVVYAGVWVLISNKLGLIEYESDFSSRPKGPLYQGGFVLSILTFYCYFWTKIGATLGMQAWGLKLVSIDGNPLTLKQCLIRCAIAPFSLGIFAIGYLWAFFDKQGLAVHDRASNTMVINVKKLKKYQSTQSSI